MLKTDSGTGIEVSAQFSRDVFPTLSRYRSESAFLLYEESLPGDIYVFGNPELVLYGGRFYSGTINGWSWEFMLPDQWEQIQQELIARPPVYLYVASNKASLIEDKAPTVISLLTTKYVVRSRGTDGTWYELVL